MMLPCGERDSLTSTMSRKEIDLGLGSWWFVWMDSSNEAMRQCETREAEAEARGRGRGRDERKRKKKLENGEATQKELKD